MNREQAGSRDAMRAAAEFGLAEAFRLEAEQHRIDRAGPVRGAPGAPANRARPQAATRSGEPAAEAARSSEHPARRIIRF